MLSELNQLGNLIEEPLISKFKAAKPSQLIGFGARFQIVFRSTKPSPMSYIFDEFHPINDVSHFV